MLLVSCSAAKITHNINGGFEEEDYVDSNPDGWMANRFDITEKYAILAIDNSVSHKGKKSVLISISQNHPLKQSVYNWVRRIEGLEVSSIYELEGWIKTEGIQKSPYFEIQCWDKNKIIGRASTEQMYSLTGTKDWRYLKTIFTIPKGMVKVLLVAGVRSSENNGGKVWFDDIQIRKIR